MGNAADRRKRPTERVSENSAGQTLPDFFDRPPETFGAIRAALASREYRPKGVTAENSPIATAAADYSSPQMFQASPRAGAAGQWLHFGVIEQEPTARISTPAQAREQEGDDGRGDQGGQNSPDENGELFLTLEGIQARKQLLTKVTREKEVGSFHRIHEEEKEATRATNDRNHKQVAEH